MSKNPNHGEPLSPHGSLVFAESYLIATKAITDSDECTKNRAVYLGPLLQMVGLTTELMWKTLLREEGLQEDEIKSIGHNLVKLFNRASDFIDVDLFLDEIYKHTSGLEVPDAVRTQIKQTGMGDPEVEWRNYFAHLSLLNDIYDRPFQTRYPTTGSHVYPDAQILIVGADVLRLGMIKTE